MNDFLEYKGYIGNVAYSGADEVFHGKLLGISDHIIYEGDSITTLKRDFMEAVDDYLQSCEELGKPPELPTRGRFDVNVPPELHKKLVVFSAARKQPINSIVEEALRRYVG